MSPQTLVSNSILTEEHCQIISGLSYLVEHLLVDPFDVISELHVFWIRQPIEDFLLVVDITVVIYVLPLTEVRNAGWVTETVLLRHQSVLQSDDLYTVLSSLVVDQFDVPEYPGTLWILLLVYGIKIFLFVSMRGKINSLSMNCSISGVGGKKSWNIEILNTIKYDQEGIIFGNDIMILINYDCKHC